MALVASSGAAVPAKQPKCGDTITADMTLHKDLVNCPNNGIIIGADNVTLDLNGHTIDGDGTPFRRLRSRTEPCDVGVADARRDGIVVKHGSVREFEFGLQFGAIPPPSARAFSTRGTDLSASSSLGPIRCLVRNSAGNRSKGEGDGVASCNRITIGSWTAPSGATAVTESSPPGPRRA